MDALQPAVIEYKRARFTALLPAKALYTPAHFWLTQQEQGVWKIGLTKFATRMLGEMVDFGFEVAPGAEIAPGQKIGWMEGFKAVSELYAAAKGSFLLSNPALEKDVTLVNKDPHGLGWIYQAKGTPAPECVDATGYSKLLDDLIDELQKGR